ncbi:hypothetical protein M406DRAFT_324900, partial [Cryphonectria parasitica EP155]
TLLLMSITLLKISCRTWPPRSRGSDLAPDERETWWRQQQCINNFLRCPARDLFVSLEI